ncbi:MAG: CopD family protein [Elusimicrobia bacterium]|nr:CopD family protein [Elusimicrobiota bacterium]
MLAWLLALHTLGIALWVAGVFGAGRVMIDHVRGGAPGGPLLPTARRLLSLSGHTGMTLAIVTGLGALTQNPGYYLHEAWLHAKLAAFGLAMAATIVLTIAAKRLAQPQPTVGERAIKLWRGLFMGAVAAALVFVFVKPI